MIWPKVSYLSSKSLSAAKLLVHTEAGLPQAGLLRLLHFE